MLVQLIYCSIPVAGATAADAAAIVRTARTLNSKNALTGILLFSPGVFLQVLEGSAEAVNRTYHRIALDPRHHSLRLLRYDNVLQRSFPAWGMGFCTLTESSRALVRRYSPTAEFNPRNWSGQSALDFAVRFTEHRRHLEHHVDPMQGRASRSPVQSHQRT